MALKLTDDGEWLDDNPSNATTLPAGTNPSTGKPFTNTEVVKEVKNAVFGPETEAEKIEPSATKRALAATGAVMQEPFLGAAEKFRLAFPGKGKEEKIQEEIARDRAERRRHLAALEETPAGQFGSFMGAAPAALTKRIAPAMSLMGGLGFLGGGPEKPTSLVNELATSAVTGALDAAATGVSMKGVEAVGRGINAARGSYTPRGQAALDLDASANRLNIEPKLTIGQLDPTSSAGVVEKNLPGYGARVQEQADSLIPNLNAVRNVPNPAGGTMQQVMPGAKLQEAAQNAIRERQTQATKMYGDVKDFAQANNLGNIDPTYTVNVLGSLNKQLTTNGKQPTGNNLAFNLLDHYNPDAFTWLKQAGSPQNARAQGMDMLQYHEARVAVGKAINSLERIPPPTRTEDQRLAHKGLIDLKNALDSDVERWAKQNKGNQEAMELYNRAKDFYATTVAPAVNNPLARKFTSTTRGFQSPEQMYNAVLNPNNASLLDLLLPTMSKEGKDLTQVFRGIPDLGRTVASREAPEARGTKGVLTALSAVLGHPVSTIAEAAPGLRFLSSQRPAKRLYFAQNPLEGAAGRPLSAAAQYPAQQIEDWAPSRVSKNR